MTSQVIGAEQALEELLQSKVEREGLTATVLQEVVDSLTEKEEQLLYAVYAALETEYSKGPQLDARVDEAAIQLGVESGTARKEEKQVSRLAAQHKEICTKIQPTEEAAESSRVAAQLHGQLEDIDTLLANSRFLEAAKSISKAAFAFKPTQGNDETRSQLLNALEERAAGLAKILTAGISTSYNCWMPNSTTCCMNLDESANLHESWEALHIVSEAQPALEQLAGKMSENLLLSVASSRSVAVQKLVTDGWLLLTAQLEVDSTQGVAVEEALMEIFSFVAGKVFGTTWPLFKRFGKLVWPQTSAALIHNKLTPAVPTSDDSFAEFEAIAQPAVDLEAALLQQGILEDNAESRPIHTFVRQSTKAWLQKKRLQLVDEARRLILDPQHDTVQVGQPLPSRDGQPGIAEGSSSADTSQPLQWGSEGKEAPLLAEGEYQVSQTGKLLVELVRKGLLQAADCSNLAVAKSTLSGVRDVAAMLAALPPVVQRREMQVPQIAAIYRNDCFYVAQHLLTLPHCYPQLKQSQRLHISFSKDALALREAGKEALAILAQRQCQELEELLEGAEGFARVHKAQRGIKARKAVQQALHLLRRLGAVLRGVLPPAAFVDMGSLVISALAEKAVNDVLRISDISVEESEDLPRILDPIASEAGSTFVGSQARGQANQNLDNQELIQALEMQTTALLKLKVIIEILGARLVDIQQWWQSSRLRQHGFTAEDVLRLIAALFEDTDLRQDVIRSIMSSDSYAK